MGLMYGRVPPKLSEDRRLRSSRGPRTVLEARGRTLNPVCREHPGDYNIITLELRFQAYNTNRTVIKELCYEKQYCLNHRT